LDFGLMITADGPKVIEYNCRVGDPETQVVLPLLKSDLLTVMQACTDGTLAQTDVSFSDDCTCCVILASGGYPVKYRSGYPITGLEEAEKLAEIYHAGTRREADGTIVTAGGRVLGVTCSAHTLREAVDRAYRAADCISFRDRQLRRDIGQRALKAEGIK
jgi:phosphoribosylamine--glycine ligase